VLGFSGSWVAEESLGSSFCGAPADLLSSGGLAVGPAAWTSEDDGCDSTCIPACSWLPTAFELSEVAIVLFLVAKRLVTKMDVPTRQSYVAAVVFMSERTFCASA